MDSTSLESFAKQFSAAIAMFNSFSTTTKLLHFITALMLLNNASIEHRQRGSALSASALTSTVFLEQASYDDFLKEVTYYKVLSTVKPCEKANKIAVATMPSTNGGSGRNV